MVKIKKGVYTTSELAELLGSKNKIKSEIDRETLFKLGRGYYSTVDLGYNSAILAIVAKFYSEGVVSGHSSLFHWGLSDYEPDQISLSYERNSRFRRNSELFEFKRVVESRIMDVQKVKINGSFVQIYSPERALFEALKLEKGFGSFSAQACLKYIQKFKVNIGKIAELSQEFGPEGILLFRFISAYLDINSKF